MMVIVMLHLLALRMRRVPPGLGVLLLRLGDVVLARAIRAHGECRDHLLQTLARALRTRGLVRTAHQSLKPLAAIPAFEIVDGHSQSLLHPPQGAAFRIESNVMTAAAIVLAALWLSAPGFAQWLHYPTPGIPRLPNGQPNLSAPAPRTPDGRPDLSGIWAAECSIYDSGGCFLQSRFFDLARGLNPEDVQMTPWASVVQAQRESRQHVDDPYGYCLPPGVPRIDFGGGPFKVLQTPAITAILYETLVGMIFRQVFTDGRPLTASDQPTWLGYSVGRWESDTFIVESTGFRDGGWLDTLKGRPSSDALHVTERFRRTDFGHMDLAITITDPKAYVKPWTIHAALNLQPDTELIEAFCDEHDKTMEHRRITPPLPEPPSPASGTL